MDLRKTMSSLKAVPVTPLNILAGLGALTLTTTTIKVLSALYFHLHRSNLKRYHHGPSDPNTKSPNDSQSQNPWALVTGASDGCGLAFVHELATRSFNVVLHGRNETKLNNAISTLRQSYPNTEFKILIIDAAKIPDSSTFDSLVLSVLGPLNLTVVIHNVGGGGSPATQSMQLFEDKDAATMDSWIDINARFATQLTRVLLPQLIKAQPALFLFISSGVTEMTAPYVAIYTAAKQFIEGLARTLQMEFQFKGYDIEVMSLTFGTVVTASSGRSAKDEAFTMPTTENVVKASFDKVGLGVAKCTPWIGHWVQLGFFKMLPGWLANRLVLGEVKKVRGKMEEAEKRK